MPKALGLISCVPQSAWDLPIKGACCFGAKGNAPEEGQGTGCPGTLCRFFRGFQGDSRMPETDFRGHRQSSEKPASVVSFSITSNKGTGGFSESRLNKNHRLITKARFRDVMIEHLRAWCRLLPPGMRKMCPSCFHSLPAFMSSTSCFP